MFRRGGTVAVIAVLLSALVLVPLYVCVCVCALGALAPVSTIGMADPHRTGEVSAYALPPVCLIGILMLVLFPFRPTLVKLLL